MGFLNSLFGIESGVAGPVPTTPDEALSKKRKAEVYTLSKQNPFAAFFNREILPDPTIAKFGGGNGFDLYYKVRRQITELGGIVGQLVDGVMRRSPKIIAGDLSDTESVRVALEQRRLWENIPGKAVSLRKSIDTLVTCGFAPIELVWDRDPSTGIVAPIGMMRADGRRGPGLIDRPAQNFTFDLDGNAQFLSAVDPWGEPIEPLKFILLRAGSLNSGWGESQFTELYSAAWLYQQVRQMMLDAVEKYGRPIPHVLIPKTMQPEDVANLDAFYTAKFGVYTRALHDGSDVEVQYPAMAMASAGAAGRSEIEALRYLQGTMYIRLLRTQQTQDKTGGSLALESTRQSITEVATLTFGDILCEGLQEGYMRPVMQINYPNLDPQLWPRFVPDPAATIDRQLLHQQLIEGIDRGILYSKQEYFTFFGLAEARDADDVLGHPLVDVIATVQGSDAATVS